MRKLIILFCVSLFLLTSCKPVTNHNSSSSMIEDNSNVLTEATPVGFEEIKNKLVGGYNCHHGPLNYNFIFFENGDYIVIDPQTYKQYNRENSKIEYFLINRKNYDMLISITHNDGTKIQFYANEQAIQEYYEFPFPLIKIKADETFTIKRNEKPWRYYTLDGFKNIKVGESEYWDIVMSNNVDFYIYVTEYGYISDFPMEDGRYIRMRFGVRDIEQNQITRAEWYLTDIDISEERVNVYF